MPKKVAYTQMCARPRRGPGALNKGLALRQRLLCGRLAIDVGALVAEASGQRLSGLVVRRWGFP